MKLQGIYLLENLKYESQKTQYERFLELESIIPYQLGVFDEFYESNKKIKNYKVEKDLKKSPDITKQLRAKMSHIY